MIRVRMADYKICNSPERISTVGLGSCLGVVLCDEVSGLCGMAHIMLPDSTRLKCNDEKGNRRKFADTCLEDMFQEMLKRGANPMHMYSKIAGGAKMFAFESQSEVLNIGEQNVNAVRSFLKAHNIPIRAEHVGEHYGRTIVFCPEDGSLKIRVVGKGKLEI